MDMTEDAVPERRGRYGVALRCSRFWLVVAPPMWPALAAYALGYLALRLAARIKVLGGTSQVGPVRIGGRLVISAAALFRFYEPLISWESRRRAR